MTNFSETFLRVGILALVVIAANVAERRDWMRSVVFGAILALNVAFVAAYGFLIIGQPERPIDIETVMLVRFVAALVGVLTTLMLFPGFRRRLATFFPKRTAESPHGGFDPNSPVHLTALVFCTLLLASTFLDLIVLGGMSGLADQLDLQDSLVINGQVINLIVFLLFATLGVGFNIRRPLRQVIERLGLYAPSPRDLLIGSGTAVAMIGVAYGIGIFWQLWAGVEAVEEQTQVSALLSQSITTLGVAFIVSGTAAVGEEIAFRGALQPIFGVVVTSLLFALVHIQYALTPASLIIVIVGFAMGILRQRYNTTTAIVAHFLYNYGQMFVLLLVRMALPLT
jgi:hypothetical protein